MTTLSRSESRKLKRSLPPNAKAILHKKTKLSRRWIEKILAGDAPDHHNVIGISIELAKEHRNKIRLQQETINEL